MGHGQSQLGRLHGDIHSDWMGGAHWTCQSSRDSGGHHIRFVMFHGVSADVWEADETVAGANGI